jgi:hypothetical protein
MASREISLDWQLHHVRDAIASDWDALASDALSAEQRRSVREHLNMNLAELRELKARMRAALHSEIMRRKG